ncbi:galactose kinase domain protein [Enterobacter hormaechei subsp. xiangfangensis]|nr:galactose kinase domain protein [Enterobacter hormaechei subsp. xiangfangensis]
MSLKDKTQSLFAEKFGYPATHVIQAPGRVNLIGEPRYPVPASTTRR